MTDYFSSTLFEQHPKDNRRVRISKIPVEEEQKEEEDENEII